MDRAHLVVIGAAGLVGVLLAKKIFDGATVEDASSSLIDSGADLIVNTASVVGLDLWRAPAAYEGMITAAENKYGMPPGLLERQLYQECHWRKDIITGAKTSPVGALGIAQFMPATAAQFGIDPLDPAQAIDAAGKYMSQLYAKLGSWALALAAYNWGIGNVQRKGIDAAPPETVSYYKSILSDVGLLA